MTQHIHHTVLVKWIINPNYSLDNQMLNNNQNLTWPVISEACVEHKFSGQQFFEEITNKKQWDILGNCSNVFAFHIEILL